MISTTNLVAGIRGWRRGRRSVAALLRYGEAIRAGLSIRLLTIEGTGDARTRAKTGGASPSNAGEAFSRTDTIVGVSVGRQGSAASNEADKNTDAQKYGEKDCA